MKELFTILFLLISMLSYAQTENDNCNSDTTFTILINSPEDSKIIGKEIESQIYNSPISNYHLKFKGIEIKESVSTFCDSLEKKGLIFEKYDGIGDAGCRSCKGKFAGYDAFIIVDGSPITQTVWNISVMIDAKNKSFDSLVDLYYYFVQNYTDKYGKPRIVQKYFISPYKEGDGKELEALAKYLCNYNTTYVLDEGLISINIMENGIFITYMDKIGILTRESERKSTVNDDI